MDKLACLFEYSSVLPIGQQSENVLVVGYWVYPFEADPLVTHRVLVVAELLNLDAHKHNTTIMLLREHLLEYC